MSGDSSRAAFVEMKGVSVARGEQTVLHDINLMARRGECIAILGPNGCGKSTLIKAMTCELYPLSRPGTLCEMFGRSRWDVTELRQRMGLVTSEPPCRSALKTTTLDVVTTGFFSSATLWPNLVVTEEMRAAARAALEQMGVAQLHGRCLGHLSAGQQKRVMIARALVGSGALQDDRMLLLDEPCNALDLGAQSQLRETLRSLAHAGTGLVLVTHHVADIVPEITRVIFMSEGRIVADGRRTEMLTGAQLSKLFQKSVNLQERDGFLHAW